MIENTIEVQRFTREAGPIVLRRVADELPEIQRGWAEFEELVGLRGRKFYGVVDQDTDEYLLATAVRDSDPADRWGLEVGELAGGAYLRAVLLGEPPDVYTKIGPTMAHLHTLAEADPARHDVEYYRRSDVIELWMPVT
jgi:hypothetical protein